MTETAAIALMVLDRRPDLAPSLRCTECQQFQRLLVWLVANVYPAFTFVDYPKRWAPDAPIIEHHKSPHIWLNSQLIVEPYVLGEQLTLTDCHLRTMRTRGPGYKWLQDNAPDINVIIDAACQILKLQEVSKRNVIT